MIFNKAQPNYKMCLEKANMILLSSNEISRFPFSVKKVVKDSSSISCKSYFKAGMYGIDMKDFGSDDAVIIQLNLDKKIIFYNESISAKSRIKFSILHEFGHDQMNHYLNDSVNYQIKEIEANFFAAQLLMPEQIINELIKRGKTISKDNLILWFGVSEQAADRRLNTLRKIDFSKRKYDEKDMDEMIVTKYKTFIDSIAPKSLNYYDYEAEEEIQSIRNNW